MKNFKSKLEELEHTFKERNPELEITVRDPVLGVEGYCVCWNTGISKGGPLELCAKGGTRVTPNLSIEEIKMLASRMALKNAAAGLPLGGAKSGLRADSQDPDIEIKFRRFVQLLKPILRENGGVFGGFGWDIGARPEYVKWACEEIGSTKSFTGKPVDLGGTDYDKEGIAGFGVAIAAKTLVEASNESLKNLSSAVQGLGAMGAAVVRYISEFGGVVTAVSDPRIGGSYVDTNGFPKELLQHFSTQNFDAAREILKNKRYQALPLDEVLFQTCDILFPCAIQDVVTIQNCHKIQARYFVEGANDPTSSAAYDALHARGIKIVPDIIANPGGIIAAFIEMTSTVSPAENVKTRKIITQAKEYTETKITENVKTLINLVTSEKVAANYAGRYMALKNILS